MEKSLRNQKNLLSEELHAARKNKPNQHLRLVRSRVVSKVKWENNETALTLIYELNVPIPANSLPFKYKFDFEPPFFYT